MQVLVCKADFRVFKHCFRTQDLTSICENKKDRVSMEDKNIERCLWQRTCCETFE